MPPSKVQLRIQVHPFHHHQTHPIQYVTVLLITACVQDSVESALDKLLRWDLVPWSQWGIAKSQASAKDEDKKRVLVLAVFLRSVLDDSKLNHRYLSVLLKMHAHKYQERNALENKLNPLHVLLSEHERNDESRLQINQLQKHSSQCGHRVHHKHGLLSPP